MDVKQYEDDFYGEELAEPKREKKKKKKVVSLDGQIIQRTGKITPAGKNMAAGLNLKVSEKEIYEIVMDSMGQKLLNFKYQELLVQGRILITSSGIKTITVMNYI